MFDLRERSMGIYSCMERTFTISNLSLVFLLLLALIFCFSRSTAETDTLKFGKSIRDGQTLVSTAGNFALGFFSPGNSTARYVGIWYFKIPEQTVIWVANRKNPIPHKNSGVLSISGDNGDLIITDTVSGSYVVIANGSSMTNPSAKLLDTGNLVLREGKSRERSNEGGGERVLWQSFDHPTDSFVPYMTITINGTTGENHVLTSWKSAVDPSPGDYSFGLDENDTIAIRRRGILIWNGRARNGEVFSSAPDMASAYIMNFSYVSDGRGNKFFGLTTNNDSVYTRGVISRAGLWQRFSWSPSKRLWILYLEQPLRGCNISSLCGAFGVCKEGEFPPCVCLESFEPSSVRDWNMGVWSGGCRRESQPSCGGNVTGGGDGFLKLPKKVRFGGDDRVNNSKNLRMQYLGSREDCKLRCLRNCSCNAYAYDGDGGGDGHGRCYLWEGELFDLRQLQKDDGRGRDIYLRLPKATEGKDAPTPGYKGGRNKKLLWLLFIMIIPIFIFLACAKIIHNRRKKEESGLVKGWNEDGGLHLFSFAQIVAATNNFSPENKLGQGGFGTVYKGKLHDGEEIAVKRLSKCSTQGMNEFINEAMLIASIQHSNLIKLLGCCSEGEEKMLICEYLPNKSLDRFLFDDSMKHLLDWKKRNQIIDGIAQGLLYLHVFSRVRIIHRDLKASNILLDGDLNPKISDFGMARILNQDETNASTTKVVGTYGYMSPEYAMEGHFSVKSDVYSFGVLLLEILSSQKINSFYHFDRSLNLIEFAWELWKEGKTIEFMDPELLVSSFNKNELEKYIHVALLCVQKDPAQRPSMFDVVSMLKNEVAVLPTAVKPDFFDGSSYGKFGKTDQEASTVNDVSSSSIKAR